MGGPTKYEYPNDNDPSLVKGTIRVHSSEPDNPRYRVLNDWETCGKPQEVGGCNSWLAGYFIRHPDGTLQKAVKLKLGACDWNPATMPGDSSAGGKTAGSVQ